MERQRIRRIVDRFGATFGSREGLLCARAPGRVNLIGEHTDYNGGFVMPMAVDREVRVFFRPTDAGPTRVWSENYGEWDEFDLTDIEPNPAQPWSNYLRGAAWALLEAGLSLRPVEAIVCGDVPIGAGLSSSAALEVSAALAFLDATPDRIDRRRLALICQRAENEFVGVNCGIMDQFVALHAEPERAVLIDCRSLDYRLLPLDTSQVRVVVCNTMVHHELGSSAYNQRRATCEAAAAVINKRLGGVEQLRDVSPQALQECRGDLSDLQYRRSRHVVSEDARAQGAVAALEAGDYEAFGGLMNASHDSLRDDYEVSCEELDTMVDIARRQPGVLGARMTGGGFGGCTVNLVRRESAESVTEAVRKGYEEATGIDPEIYQFQAVAGAGVEKC